MNSMYSMQKVYASVGMMSLVGVMSNSFPVTHGNYFSFSNGLRCINMWAENLEHAVSCYLHDTYVQVHVWQDRFEQWGVVVDDRLPEGYTTSYPCFTGSILPSKEILKEMGKMYGWTTHPKFKHYVE